MAPLAKQLVAVQNFRKIDVAALCVFHILDVGRIGEVIRHDGC